MKTETYIVNGSYFHSMDKVEKYVESLGMRITNTETLRKNVYLITIGK